MFGEIVVKRDVAIGSGAEFLAIDGNGGIAINPVEVDGDALAGEGGRNLEFLTVVGHASDAIAAFVGLSSVFLRTRFPGPVVGKGDGLPVFAFLIGLAFKAELPLAHQGEDFACEEERAEKEEKA